MLVKDTSSTYLYKSTSQHVFLYLVPVDKDSSHNFLKQVRNMYCHRHMKNHQDMPQHQHSH